MKYLSTNNRGHHFWLFQLGGWGAWVIMLVLRDLYFIPAEYIFPRIMVFCLSAGVGVVITAGLRHLYIAKWEKGLALRLSVTLLGSLLAAVCWQPIRNSIALIPFGEGIDLIGAGIEGLFDGVFSSALPLMLFWSGLYYSIKYSQLYQLEKEKGLRSEALAHEAQLLMLRYQLNPHFLFNTLNAISTLVLAKATDQANEMLTKLSKFLRYSLDHSPLDRVTLAHELQTSNLYLDIEKVRFGDRLSINCQIDDGAEQALVPTMLLQPIIENSIKHAISKSECGGSIEIRAKLLAGKLELEVLDDGPGLNSEDVEQAVVASSAGIGISNIHNRLKEIYGEHYEVRFTNVEPHGLSVKVVIPYDIE